MNEQIVIYPKAEVASLLLTATEPISHHDPAIGKTGNRITFNRQKQMIPRDIADQVPSQKLLDTLFAANPMTEMVNELVKQLTLPEFIAVAMIRQFIDIYKSTDGVGLFKGIDRYTMLEDRMKNAAIRSHKLHSMWSNVAANMKVPFHFGKYDEPVTIFWILPQSIQYQVLSAIVENARSLISIAKMWNRQMKGQSKDYVASFGGLFNPQVETVAEYDLSDTIVSSDVKMIIEVPAISANTIRHQMVRAPGWSFLAHQLGIAPAQRNKGEISQGAEGIFVNGGNIEQGAQQPSNAWKLAGEIREAFPHLDLIGGCTDKFDIGRSSVDVCAWIVCCENEANLPQELRETPQARMSVFDMLDEVTHTRHATSQGFGQMIYTYEVLIPGTQIYTEFSLHPSTLPMTKGALMCALNTYLSGISVVAGQSARGSGHVRGEWIAKLDDDCEEERYINYVMENKQRLREWIVDGTLGSSSVVVT